MNLIEKYLAKAAGKEHVAPGQDLTCKVSFVAAHDVTAPIAIRMFREIGVKKVFDPSRVALIVDHVYPAATEKARANVWAMDDFSKEFGVPLYQRGEGVIHQLMYEKHKQNPGDIVCIADSHTGTCGGYGQIGIGVGSTELAAAMATGTLDLEVPQVVQIYLTGKRPSNVFGKDLILYLGSKFGSDYLVDRGLLLTGPGIDDLSIAERMTVCNMGIEIGSMITIFGTEEKESDCFETYEIDLSTLEPQISCPFSPANVVPVREKAGIKVTQVVVGSCTNGRLNDMEQVAKAFKARRSAPTSTCSSFPPPARSSARWKSAAGRRSSATPAPPFSTPAAVPASARTRVLSPRAMCAFPRRTATSPAVWAARSARSIWRARLPRRPPPSRASSPFRRCKHKWKRSEVKLSFSATTSIPTRSSPATR